MTTKILSATLVGLDAVPVEVEADIAQGLPNFVIVGLPDTAVQESRERVRAAIRNSGLPFPRTRLTVNLAPANIRKEGPRYDLPIAVAILEAAGAVPPESGRGRMFLGELALDGTIRRSSGVLSAALLASSSGIKELYVPCANAAEAALAAGIAVYPLPHLTALIRHLRGEAVLRAHEAQAQVAEMPEPQVDFRDIRGQSHAKRALEIAAAGGHNVLLSGPPGSGKTMLARALAGIMPPLLPPEALEATKIASVAGLLADGRMMDRRPFRAPHHTASATAMIGGGSWPRPGEITLAHRGVLFLDEFPEFPRSVMENLRQPMEDGFVSVVRTGGTAMFPCRFTLVAARNPCPCGYADDPEIACTCAPAAVAAYARRISGPIMDRIDLHVTVPRQSANDLLSPAQEEASSQVRTRVAAARERQAARYAGSGYGVNSEIDHRTLRKACVLGKKEEALLCSAISKLKLSARSVGRLLRTARTIADLDAAERIATAHLAEAVQYREKAVIAPTPTGSRGG